MIFDEEAKALQEVAKAGQMFGSFISRIIGGSLEQGVGIFEDKLKYMRLERAARLECSFRELQKELGLEEPDKAIPMKYAVPLFQAATLEDDDYIQNLWVNLLVKASHKEFNFDINRTYIDILERLSHLEAKILLKIYELPYEKIKERGVLTTGLPEKVTLIEKGFITSDDNKLDDESIILALSNLSRLGCIFQGGAFADERVFEIANPTLLGKRLVDSCTFKMN